MHKRTAISIICILIGLIIVVAALITRHIRLQSPIVFLDEPQQVVNDTDDGVVPTLRRDGETMAEIAPDQQSGYQSAPTRPTLAEESKRLARSKIIVNADCIATPATLTVAPQQTVLIENQSDRKRDIVIGPRTYAILAHDYVLAAFAGEGTFALTCDDGPRSGGRVIVKE